MTMGLSVFFHPLHTTGTLDPAHSFPVSGRSPAGILDTSVSSFFNNCHKNLHSIHSPICYYPFTVASGHIPVYSKSREAKASSERSAPSVSTTFADTLFAVAMASAIVLPH